MGIFERSCPKTLTQGPLPRHYILANSLCLSSLFTVLKIHIVWSMVLGVESCFGVNANYTSEQLSWQRNLSTWGDKLTSKLCLYKIHGCYWLRLLGSKKSNPTSVQFLYVVLTLPLPTHPPAELALFSDSSFFAQHSPYARQTQKMHSPVKSSFEFYVKSEPFPNPLNSRAALSDL